MSCFGYKSTNVALKTRSHNVLSFNMVSKRHPIIHRFSTFCTAPLISIILDMFVNLPVNVTIMKTWNTIYFTRCITLIIGQYTQKWSLSLLHNTYLDMTWQVSPWNKFVADRAAILFCTKMLLLYMSSTVGLITELFSTLSTVEARLCFQDIIADT